MSLAGNVMGIGNTLSAPLPKAILNRDEPRTVYLCHPVTGMDPDQVDIIVSTGIRLADDSGVVPIATWAMWRGVIDGTGQNYDRTLAKCLQLVSLCDELWVLTDYITRGMRMEIERASELHKQIKFHVVDRRVKIDPVDLWSMENENKGMQELSFTSPDVFPGGSHES